MFKAAFITDLHFGIRGNSDVFLNNTRDYLYNEFIPSVKENGITHIFIGGDIFDSRQSVNIKTLNYAFEFFQKLKDENFKVVVIAGNHDLYLSSSNDYTSIAFVSNFSNVTFIRTGMQRIQFEGTNIMFIPWVSNMDTFINEMGQISKYVDCKICIGHFEFIGFRMNRSKIMDTGMPCEALTSIFDTIISGHYHMRNEKIHTNGSRIIYTGTPYQLTRADAGDSRGYAILNFDGQKMTDIQYINNKKSIRFESVTFPEEFTEEKVRGNIVDVIVNYADKFDEVKLEEYKSKIESFGPAFKPEVRLLTANTAIDMQTELNGFAVKTTADLIGEFLDGVEIENKERVRKEIIDLYEKVRVSE